MTTIQILITALVVLHLLFSFATASLILARSGGHCYTPMWMLYCLFLPYIAFVHFAGFGGIWSIFYLMFINPFVQVAKRIWMAFGVLIGA